MEAKSEIYSILVFRKYMCTEKLKMVKEMIQLKTG